MKSIGLRLIGFLGLMLVAANVASGALLASPAAAAAAVAAGCGVRCLHPPPVKTVDDGYVYSYDDAQRAFVGVAHVTVTGAPGVQYEATYVIDCGIVAPPAAGGGPPAGLDCQRARCQAGAQVGRWIVVFYREIAPDPAPGWTRGDRRCVVARPPVPVTAVDAAVRDYVRKHLAAADPVVQPGAVTLVNFPTIVSTPDPGEVTFTIAQPLPGVVRVHPTFTWVFTDADGSRSVATGPGRPYDGTGPETGPPGIT